MKRSTWRRRSSATCSPRRTDRRLPPHDACARMTRTGGKTSTGGVHWTVQNWRIALRISLKSIRPATSRCWICATSPRGRLFRDLQRGFGAAGADVAGDTGARAEGERSSDRSPPKAKRRPAGCSPTTTRLSSTSSPATRARSIAWTNCGAQRRWSCASNKHCAEQSQGRNRGGFRPDFLPLT